MNDFGKWWEKSGYCKTGSYFDRGAAEAAWKARGESDAAIARQMNSPRVAGALSAEYEVGQVHD